MIVRPARWPDEADAVRVLLREYGADEAHAAGLCFQRFDDELAGLPGKYAEPDGCFLLADDNGELVGCVALRKVTDQDAEMKRLYVRPAARGTGAGQVLAERVIAEARARGYRRLCLDTLPHMTAAIRLYRRLGFVDVPPYLPEPTPGATCLGLNLSTATTPG
jgi:ribosomal protein S18 acetylase RimI-like enzyme